MKCKVTLNFCSEHFYVSTSKVHFYLRCFVFRILSGTVLLSHSKTNPPKSRGCALLLRKQRHSPNLCHNGSAIPGISLSLLFIFFVNVCHVVNLILISHTGTPWRRLLSLHRLQWWERVWRIEPKGIKPHSFLPFKT